MPRINEPTAEERAEMAGWLQQELRFRHDATMACMRWNSKVRDREPPYQTSLYGLTARHGVGRWGERLPPGMRKLANKLCFTHATSLMWRGRGRLIYCEGYALRRSMGMAVNHAWVLDRWENYRVIDNTWEAPVTGAYLGIPLSSRFVARTMCETRVYGVMDNWKQGFPMLTMDPADFLHEDAGDIPADFEVKLDESEENVFERLRRIEEEMRDGVQTQA